MKRIIIAFLIIATAITAFAQDPKESKEENKKTGWSFGALPSITYSTDLGFQYGALINLYNYGDGSRYPEYNHSLYFEVSRFTKGSGINRFYYDSDRLTKGLRTSFDLSYLVDQAYDFYGFNGYNALIDQDYFDDESDDYISRMFYKYDRKIFRFKIDLQGKIKSDYLRWTAGINLKNYKIGSVDLDKLNKGKDDNEKIPDVPGLYEHYTRWGVIGEKEKDGGFVPLLKAGIVYDTRDNRANPMRGIWSEAVIGTAPEFFGSEGSFTKIGITHRQYFTIIPNNMSLVYRLAYQTTIAGKTPFYFQNHIMTSYLTGASNEGLGGNNNIRGVFRNRIVGDGIFYGNVEARYIFTRFQLLKNNFYLGLNGFWDFGMVTKEIEFTPLENTDISKYYNTDEEKLHNSAGLGLKIAMNQNFILSIDYGFALDKEDGKSALYIGLNYIF